MSARIFFSPRPWSLLLGVLLAYPSEILGQEEARVTVPAAGFQIFAHLLHKLDLRPIEKVAALDGAAPEETLIIVLGKLDLEELHARFAGGLTGFLNRGGALLIASSFPDGGALRPWGIEIPGAMVRQTQESSYQGYEACPLISPDAKLDHPLFFNLKRGLATNSPSLLRLVRKPPSSASGMVSLLDFPADTWLIEHGPHQATPKPYAYAFGSAADAPPSGRVLVLGGEGVFINAMMFNHDNDNIEFARNALRWLKEGPGGDRTHVMMLYDGQPTAKFALPRVPLELILRVLNQRLAEMDQENAFNNALLDHVGHYRTYRAIWIGLGGVLFLLLLRRFVLGRVRLETWVPLLVGRKAPTPPALPLEWQRQRALEKGGNYWEPAQVLARQFFLDTAGSTIPLPDEADLNGPPEIRLDSSWRERRLLAQSVKDLWELGRTPPGRRISRRQFLAAATKIAELRANIETGKLSILTKELHGVAE